MKHGLVNHVQTSYITWNVSYNVCVNDASDSSDSEYESSSDGE